MNPMTFRTKDGDHSVRGRLVNSSKTHVKLERLDNGKTVVVEKSLLDESTLRQVARKMSLVD